MRQIFLIGLLLTVPAFGQPLMLSPDAAIGGNLPQDFYPASPCTRPDKKKVDRQSAMDIARYNKAAEVYGECIQTYITNARIDQARILAVVNARAGEAAQPVDGAGNMPADFYPKSPCVMPDKAALGTAPSPQKVVAAKPSRQQEQAMGAMAAYNDRVKLYNDQAGEFAVCHQGYVTKARNDLVHLQAALDAAVRHDDP